MTRSSGFRGVVSDSLIYGLSASLSRMTLLITAPIVTRILSPADYGVIALIQFAAGFFVLIAGMNIGSAVFFYYFKEKNSGSGNEDAVVSTGLSVSALFAATVAFLVFVSADSLARVLEWRADGSRSEYDLVLFLRLAAIGLFFSLLVTSVQTVLRLWRRPSTFLKLEMAAITLNVLLVLIFIAWLQTGVIGMFYIGIIAPLITAVFGLWIIRRVVKPSLTVVLLGSLFGYSLPQMPGVLANWLHSQLGRGFVNYYATLSELGLYAVAFSVASLLLVAVTAFRMAYDPYALSVMDKENAPHTYARGYLLYLAGFAVLAGGLAAFAKPIIMLLTPSDYHDAHKLVVYFIVAMFYMGANNILATGIWVSKRTSFTSYAQIIAIVFLLVASFSLVPRFGGLGAAVAFLIAAAVQSVAYFLLAQRLYPIPYKYIRTHIIAGSLIVIGILHGRFVADGGFVNAFASATATSVVIAVAVWHLALPREERTALTEAATHRLSFLK